MTASLQRSLYACLVGCCALLWACLKLGLVGVLTSVVGLVLMQYYWAALVVVLGVAVCALGSHYLLVDIWRPHAH